MKLFEELNSRMKAIQTKMIAYGLEVEQVEFSEGELEVSITFETGCITFRAGLEGGSSLVFDTDNGEPDYHYSANRVYKEYLTLCRSAGRDVNEELKRCVLGGISRIEAIHQCVYTDYKDFEQYFEK